MNEHAARGWGRLGPFLLVGLLAGTWAYLLFIFEPGIVSANRAQGVQFGPYVTDLYAPWAGSYALLRQGRDPYSPAVTAAIQQGYYGRVLSPDDAVTDQNRFVYPLYTVLLLAPATLVPFEVVQAVYAVVALGLLALAVQGWLGALGWRLPPGPRLLLILAGISTMPALHAYSLQQLEIGVGALLAGAGACLAAGSRAAPPLHRQPRWVPLPNRWYAGAGVLLAVATIKPQTSLVLGVWLLGWALTDRRRRGSLILGFGATLGVLLAASLWLLPTWPAAWWNALTAYRGYANDRGVIGTWLPAAFVPWVLLALGGALTLFAWRARRSEPGSLLFSLGLAFAGLYGVLLYPRVAAYTQLALFPALLVVLQQRGALRAAGRAGRWLFLLTVDLLLWSWLAATALVLAGAALVLLAQPDPLATLARYTPLPWIPGIVLPPLLLLPLGVLAGRAGRAAREPEPVAGTAGAASDAPPGARRGQPQPDA